MTVEERLQNPRSGCSLFLMAFGLLSGLAITALGIFTLSTIPGNWKEMQEVWTEAPGTITRVRVKEMQIRTGNQPKSYYYTTNYIVVLDCRYAVNGKEYTGAELVAPKQAINKTEEEQALQVAAEVYRIGDSIPVYHHPTEVAKSRLDSESPNGIFWLSVIFGPLVLLAGAGLTWWVWADWRGKMGRVKG